MRVGPKVPEIYESGPKLVRLKIFLDSNSCDKFIYIKKLKKKIFFFKKEEKRRRRLILESLPRMKSIV